MQITECQKEILLAIVKFQKENGYSPSVRELAEITERTSPATIHKHLKNLKDKGYITYEPKKVRTIKVLK